MIILRTRLIIIENESDNKRDHDNHDTNENKNDNDDNHDAGARMRAACYTRATFVTQGTPPRKFP